jgi:hypothetical protein
MDDIFWQVFWLTLICSPFAVYFKVIWSYSTLPYTQRNIQKQNILYVIAHPDDEAMFFVPSILHLKK